MNKFRIKLGTAPLHDERVSKMDDCTRQRETDKPASRNTKISLRSQAIPNSFADIQNIRANLLRRGISSISADDFNIVALSRCNYVMNDLLV